MKRCTDQSLIPVKKSKIDEFNYDIYPSIPLQKGAIRSGYESLAKAISKEQVVILDGYLGVDWNEVIVNLIDYLTSQGLNVKTIDINNCLKESKEINQMVLPYLGEPHSIFGFKSNLELNEFFNPKKLAELTVEPSADITIVFGTGASVAHIKGLLIYFDLPKNELQYRMRAKEVSNLGDNESRNAKTVYKRFYFVDWVVLNRRKKKLLPNIDIIVDQQRPNLPTWTTGDALRFNLSEISKCYFRARPWFEPGVWGGNWMKKHFKGLNQKVSNYAWSFEMIVPENGLLFEENNLLLEVSFDMLMFQEHHNVLGKAAKRFKDEFPIRFDFLDTFDGGNLSVQCHPSPDYIREEFGESFTQDETYYILDAGKNANVFLGFKESIDRKEFRNALEHSFETKEYLDVEEYIQKFPSKKHDLFLIPHGTVHCSGTDNMVLEISATPYIFTFKMYDWQRMDMDGKPRPLNIEHAFKNLDFSRKGKVVEDTLISKPYILEEGADWKKMHLPTHPDHFYNIYRYEFETEIEIETRDQCHILMLVEGQAIELKVANTSPKKFNYAETFAVPAAAKKYRLLNLSSSTAKVIVSHVKDEAC